MTVKNCLISIYKRYCKVRLIIDNAGICLCIYFNEFYILYKHIHAHIDSGVPSKQVFIVEYM